VSASLACDADAKEANHGKHHPYARAEEAAAPVRAGGGCTPATRS